MVCAAVAQLYFRILTWALCLLCGDVPWTDGRLAHQSVGFDVWNATWSSSPTRPPPAGLSLAAAAVYMGPAVIREGPVTCADPTWRRSSAAGRDLGEDTQTLPCQSRKPGAVGSSIGGADRRMSRPGCCLDPECPGLKTEESNFISQTGEHTFIIRRTLTL